MRKSIYTFVIPFLLTIGLVLLSGPYFNSVNGQTVSSNLTTSNSTVPDMSMNSANQTSQSNQTASEINLASSPSTNPMLNEKLLNYTNNAILALNEDNETEIQRNLVIIQDELIKAIGKPVVIVPAPALITDSDSESD
ncbi:hypothetical protein [Candidatus Nitrosocosmicus hydrocola]|uniref:hypothetical protein n=1 Tax=Candidatus Nitrosocosmicus hydrocola TaxID=1826872 RepID=UPI0011E5C10A|nr:hypothetical protein [Candidatus Nitrosocosmicus hydrocola]